MVIELIIVWALGVVAFFALWAILLKVIKRISEKKHKDEDTVQEKTAEKTSHQSIEGSEKAC